MKKIECDLTGCHKKFSPKAKQQRFCTKKHHDKFHQVERARLIQLARSMGIGK